MFKHIQLVTPDEMNLVVGQILEKFQGKAHTEYQAAMAEGLEWYDILAKGVSWDPDTDGQVPSNEFREMRPPVLWIKALIDSIRDLDGVEYLDCPLWVYESHSGHTSVSIWAAGGRYAILSEGDDDSSFNPRLFEYPSTSSGEVYIVPRSTKYDLESEEE